MFTPIRSTLGLAALALFIVAPARATTNGTPAFARQTGLACNLCHTHYPELTPMGRTFKLNGYVFRGGQSVQGNNPGGAQNLLLNLVSPLSIMMQTSFTQTKKAEPGTQNGTIFFPDQLSIFAGGEVTPHLGGFLQVTFDPQSGQLGIDNADFRWATQSTLLAKPATFGIDLNNNPTVQDVWNTTPAWGFPYGSSAAAPTPAAAAIIDGTLGQQVAGLTAYTLWNNQVYGEFGFYRSAPVGTNRPLDNSTDVLKGGAPYWRVALPHQFGKHYLSVGGYGMTAKVYPAGAGLTGPTNKFSDVALDLAYFVNLGNNSFSTDATWIHEKQTWSAGGTTNPTNTLNTYRLAAMYHVRQMYAFTVAPFTTTGTADAALYGGAPSASGSPNSSGVIAEADVMPWQNWRLQFQYVVYSKFNGSKTNYDGAGRNAADNNTLYIMTWLLF
jgi:hypothetical protein